MIRTTTKTIMYPSNEDGSVITIRQRRVSGLAETGIIFLALYGSFKLIKKLFENKEETEETE